MGGLTERSKALSEINRDLAKACGRIFVEFKQLSFISASMFSNVWSKGIISSD
jgi:hypothetical protein